MLRNRTGRTPRDALLTWRPAPVATLALVVLVEPVAAETAQSATDDLGLVETQIDAREWGILDVRNVRSGRVAVVLEPTGPRLVVHELGTSILAKQELTAPIARVLSGRFAP